MISVVINGDSIMSVVQVDYVLVYSELKYDRLSIP